MEKNMNRMYFLLVVLAGTICWAGAYTPLDNCTLAKSGIDAKTTGAAQFASVNWVNEPNQCSLLCKMNYGMFGKMGDTPCKAYAFSYNVPLYSKAGDLCYIYTTISDTSSIGSGSYDLYVCP